MNTTSPIPQFAGGTSRFCCTCSVEHERSKQSDWLRGDYVTSGDLMLQSGQSLRGDHSMQSFDWLMMSTH